jgi:hypothetical protein
VRLPSASQITRSDAQTRREEAKYPAAAFLKSVLMIRAFVKGEEFVSEHRNVWSFK